jgi:hypothetical protein
MNDQNGNGPTDLDAVLERITPEKRADFVLARMRLKQFHENDEILALANYLDNFAVLIDGLTKNLREAESKHLSALLKACRSCLKESLSMASKQAALSAKQIESLENEWRTGRQTERQARKEEADQARRQYEELQRTIPDVRKCAEMVRDINHGAVWWTIGIAVSATVMGTLVVEHVLLHL